DRVPAVRGGGTGDARVRAAVARIRQAESRTALPRTAGPGIRRMTDVNRALVLAGGGLAGIAWETGVLLGICDESPDAGQKLLAVDVLLGASAGSAVAAQVGSGVPLEELFARQLSEEHGAHEIHPGVSI